MNHRAEQVDGVLSHAADQQFGINGATIHVGDYGEAALDADEKRLTVPNRLKAAAVRRDLDILFRRTSGDFIRFQIIEPSTSLASMEPPAVVSFEAPAKNKGGRPKKVVEEVIAEQAPAKRKGGRPKKNP